MQRIDLKIPIYDWSLTLIVIESKNDTTALKECFEELLIDDVEVIEKIENDCFDGGETYTNQSEKYSVILVYRCLNPKMFHNCFNHEKNHFLYKMGEHLGIRDEKEASAYLDGYISEQVYDQIEPYLSKLKNQNKKYKNVGSKK